MSQTFLAKGRRNLGYTIDQTILVVAVIAILITLIIASVGWDLITRTSGTKLASYLTQIERANGTFFGRHGMWMDQALTVDGTTASDSNTNMLILQQDLFDTVTPSRFSQNHQNLLPGFAYDGVNNLINGFGDGAADTIRQDRVDLGAVGVSTSIGSGNYWVLEMQEIPFEEALNVDNAVDGAADDSGGRVTYMVANGVPADCFAAHDGSAPAPGDTVTLCYVANAIN